MKLYKCIKGTHGPVRKSERAVRRDPGGLWDLLIFLRPPPAEQEREKQARLDAVLVAARELALLHRGDSVDLRAALEAYEEK